jgi:hypothetical protein
MLGSKKVYISGVSDRHRVRCYSLISLRESSPPRTMLRIPYSILIGASYFPSDVKKSTSLKTKLFNPEIENIIKTEQSAKGFSERK